jgi:hypothetical protein
MRGRSRWAELDALLVVCRGHSRALTRTLEGICLRGHLLAEDLLYRV